MNPFQKRSHSRWRVDDSIPEENSRDQDTGVFVTDSTPLAHPPAVPKSRRLPSDGVVFLSPPPVFDEPSGRCEDYRGISATPPPPPVEVPDDLPLDSQVNSAAEAGDKLGLRDVPSVDATLPNLFVRRGESVDRQVSAGWLGSVALHLLILVLIALMVSPKDFAGVGTQVIQLSMTDLDAPLAVAMELMDNSDVQDASAAEVVPDLIEVKFEPKVIQPSAIALHSPKTKVVSGVASQSPGNSNGKSSGGSHGSFFGIHAEGHKFVYVLDRSGSMSSGRYDRATEECLRSVRGLREDQSFFVVLFSNQDRLMFNAKPNEAGPVPATPENKRRLATWLKGNREGGGTDPTSALRLAIALGPSAIFMLSDGEFQEPKRKSNPFRGGDPFDAGGDALSIVQASAATIPIHTIAFEDPRSCFNLQQIAEVTSGQYRFVKSCDRTEKELLADAKRLLIDTTDVIDPRELNDLFDELAASSLSDDGRQRIAAWVVSNKQDDLLFSTLAEDSVVVDESREKSNLRNAVDRLKLLSILDPNDSGSEVQIQDLVARVRQGLELVGTADVERAALDRIAAFPRGLTAGRIIDALADRILGLDQGDLAKVYVRCSALVAQHPGSEAAVLAAAEMLRIRDSIVGESRVRLANGNLAGAIRSLRRSTKMDGPGVLSKMANQELETLTFKTLLEIRETGLDRKRKRDLEAQLESGYEEDPRLAELKRQSNQQELAARRIAKRKDLETRDMAAESDRPTLELLVKKFPHTAMAIKAREMLANLNRRRDDPSWSGYGDDALDRMMSGDTSP